MIADEEIHRHIDPGSNGAIAMIAEDGTVEIYGLFDDMLIMLCRDWAFDECICAVEDVSSSPQMGVKSAFTFGRGFGFIQGVLRSNGIPFSLVKPNRWKVEMGCNLGKQYTTKQKKDKDIEVCKRLYPTISLKRTPKCRTDDDGFADALLLATFAKRRL